MATHALEHQRKANLLRAQRDVRAKENSQGQAKDEKRISSVEGGMMASFVFFVFDVPNAILSWFLITYLLALLWGGIGWLTVLTWLWLKGYGIFTFDTKHNLIAVFLTSYGASAIGLPGISGFIISLIIKERARRFVPGPLNKIAAKL